MNRITPTQTFGNVTFLEQGEAFAFDPIYGKVAPKDNTKKRLTIATAIYKRHKLTSLYTTYTCNYLVKELEAAGYDVVVLFCGSDEDLKALPLELLSQNYLLLPHENILGEKNNKLFKTGHSLLSDYITLIGSDDFHCSETLLKSIKKADSNGYWSTLEDIVFFCSLKKKFGLLRRYRTGIGSGRIYTEKCLHFLNDSVFAPKNKAMDASINVNLKELSLGFKERNVWFPQKMPLGLKTSENIWAYNKFKLIEDENIITFIEWVPREVLEDIIALEFNNSVI